MLKAAEDSPLHAYVVLSLVAGLRTEELRSLLWSDVDLDARTVAVYRSVRASGDTKTPKSKRVLKLPVKAVEALKKHRASRRWRGSRPGRCGRSTAWSSRRLWEPRLTRTTCGARSGRSPRQAGLGQEWTPRELRHTFVSLLSANDVTLEVIARLVGHSGTAVTERVYRHEIRPSLTQGAEVMDQIFR